MKLSLLLSCIALATMAVTQTVVAQDKKDPNLRAMRTQTPKSSPKTSTKYRTSTAIKPHPYNPPAHNNSAASGATHDLAKLEQQQAHANSAKPSHPAPAPRIKEPKSEPATTSQSFTAASPRKKMASTTTRSRQGNRSVGYHSRFGR